MHAMKKRNYLVIILFCQVINPVNYVENKKHSSANDKCINVNFLDVCIYIFGFYIVGLNCFVGFQDIVRNLSSCQFPFRNDQFPFHVLFITLLLMKNEDGFDKDAHEK